MATGTIVSVWQDGQRAHAAVSVAEGARGNVEYIGSVSLTDDLAGVGFPNQTWADLTGAQKKTALQNAVKKARDAQIKARNPIAGISGTVNL